MSSEPFGGSLIVFVVYRLYKGKKLSYFYKPYTICRSKQRTAQKSYLDTLTYKENQSPNFTSSTLSPKTRQYLPFFLRRSGINCTRTAFTCSVPTSSGVSTPFPAQLNL